VVNTFGCQRAGTIGINKKRDGTLFNTGLFFRNKRLFSDKITLIEPDKTVQTAFPCA